MTVQRRIEVGLRKYLSEQGRHDPEQGLIWNLASSVELSRRIVTMLASCTLRHLKHGGFAGSWGSSDQDGGALLPFALSPRLAEHD
jgi:hypothetical protein